MNAGNYLGRGDEYVRRLRGGIERNLLKPHTFHVLTEGDGWWSKIHLFEPGRFEGRCIYFDLDTVIVNSIDHFASYRGPFAGLSDFYHTELFASGVMTWTAGEADHVFTNWVSAGKPDRPRGDGEWIGEQMPEAKRLQALFPGQFVSFKAHCAQGIPMGARAVCFHGLPRPHHLSDIMRNW